MEDADWAVMEVVQDELLDPVVVFHAIPTERRAN